MQDKSIAECSKKSILLYFRPSLSYHLSLRPLFCLFLSGRLGQVFLYFKVLQTLKLILNKSWPYNKLFQICLDEILQATSDKIEFLSSFCAEFWRILAKSDENSLNGYLSFLLMFIRPDEISILLMFIRPDEISINIEIQSESLKCQSHCSRRQVLRHLSQFSKKNKVWYFMRIICWQTILMKYHALFVIFEKAVKFEIVVCCKL